MLENDPLSILIELYIIAVILTNPKLRRKVFGFIGDIVKDIRTGIDSRKRNKIEEDLQEKKKKDCEQAVRWVSEKIESYKGKYENNSHLKIISKTNDEIYNHYLEKVYKKSNKAYQKDVENELVNEKDVYSKLLGRMDLKKQKFEEIRSDYSEFREKVYRAYYAVNQSYDDTLGIIRGIHAEQVSYKAIHNENPDWIVLRNVVLKNRNGDRTSENDIVIVNEHGVFTVEVKNRSYYTIETSDEGTSVTYDERKNIIDGDPLKQTLGHERFLKGYLRYKANEKIAGNVYGLILPFTAVKKVEGKKFRNRVVDRMTIRQHIEGLFPICMNQEEMKEAAEAIKNGMAEEERFKTTEIDSQFLEDCRELYLLLEKV